MLKGGNRIVGFAKFALVICRIGVREGECLSDCKGLTIRFSGFFCFGQSDLNVANVVMSSRQISLEIVTPRMRLRESRLNLECSAVRLGSLGQLVQFPLKGTKVIVAESQIAQMLRDHCLVLGELGPD